MTPNSSSSKGFGIAPEYTHWVLTPFRHMSGCRVVLNHLVKTPGTNKSIFPVVIDSLLNQQEKITYKTLKQMEAVVVKNMVAPKWVALAH